GWDTLLKNLGKTKADDEPLSFKRILESNGIKDAVWSLNVLAYKERCLFQADVAESVLHIFEAKYPDDSRPRKAIKAIRDYHAGLISRNELDAYAAYAAYDAAYAYAAYAYATAAERNAEWAEIEALFIKHFCEIGRAHV